MSEPDDTPTRHTPGLVEILNRDQLLAEVSRLREALDTATIHQNANGLAALDIDEMLTAANKRAELAETTAGDAKWQNERLVAEVSRLREQSLDYDRFVSAVFKEPIITGREYPPPVTDEDGGMSYKVAIEWLVKRSLDADRAEAEASRLQQELQANAAMLARQCDLAREAESTASRLQQENALLNRSLGILERTISEAEGR